jgi:single-stranded-DNA-specific exonuclease
MNAQISPICPEIPSSADDRLAWMLTSLARARGCKSADEVGAFLDPLPPLVNPLLELSDIDKALRRIEQALKEAEAITIFGDYDCDGVTSVAQWINLFRAAGHTNYRVYIPDRFIDAFPHRNRD